MVLIVVLALLQAASAAFATPHFPIVDVHVHTAPRHYSLLGDILASTGITRFVNLSAVARVEELEQSLRIAAESGGRILVCVNLEWRRINEPDFARSQVQLLRTAKRLGASCLKISKALGLGVPAPGRDDTLLPVDSPLLDPIWAEAGRLQFPVFIHTGDPKAFFEPLNHHNERYDELSVHPNWSFASPEFPRREALLAARDRVFTRHRSTNFIGVHFANNPEDPQAVGRQLDMHPNLYVDLAARLPELGRHDPAMMKHLFIKHQDRILFGTDLGFHRSGIMLGSVGRDRPTIPDIFLFYAQHFEWLETQRQQIQHPTPIQGRWRIDAIGLPANVLTKIYRTNALKLLWKQADADAADTEAIELSPGMVEYFD